MSQSDILVIAEHRQGRLTLQSLELVTAARCLANDLPGEVIMAVVGGTTAALAHEIAAIAGVDRVVTVEHIALEPFTAGPWVTAVTEIARIVEPFAVLIPASIVGHDYAARVAARLGAGMIPDATSLAIDNGELIAHRLVLGHQATTTVRCVGHSPRVVSVAPGAFPRAASRPDLAPIESIVVPIPVEDCRVVRESLTALHRGTRTLAESDRVVAGGRGLETPERFSLIEDLAAELDAAVGASGAAVAAGWRPSEDQIGSTGQIVNPKLYLAIGISGAPQHLAGIQGAEYVVAINRDPAAPIFTVASYGIVGDLAEVAPALIEELRRYREMREE